MALNAKQAGNNSNGGGKKFAPQLNIEAGNYPGRLVQIIDFGVQAQKPYAGKPKPPIQILGFTYELVDEFMKDEEGNDIADKPRWISEQFPLHNLKADRAISTQRIQALDPNDVTDGDIPRLLGTAVNITVVNNKSGDKVYDNVAGLSPMRPRDAANCPELINPTKVFVLDEPDMEVFNSFPEWIREKIKGNLNYNGSKLQKLLGGESVQSDTESKPEAQKAAAVELPLAVKGKNRAAPKEVDKEYDEPSQEESDGKDDLPW